MKLIEKNHLTKSLVWELPHEDVLIIRKYWVHYLSQALGAFMAIGFAVALVLSNSSNDSEQMTLNELGYLPFGITLVCSCPLPLSQDIFL